MHILSTYRSAHNQTFQYDNMNRLTSGQAGTLWGNTNKLDAFGNLYQFNPISGVTPGQTMALTPTTNNQLSGGRVAYDAAGNMSSDMTGTAYLYDAENRIATVGSTAYSYDGDGNRVMKLGGSANWAYWYGTNGEVLNEFNTTGGGNYVRNVYLGGALRARRYASTSIDYIAGDQIGSARVVVNASGTVEDNSDYMPFGGTANYSTSTSGDIYKFTGKERDTESGLDYFGARYYSSNMGRWMSPDWADKPEAVPYSHLEDPQSLNLYNYVGNNPLSKPDLDGHGCPPDCSTGNDVVDFFLGAGNAFASDNLAGAGRVNQTSAGGQLGQTLGDGLAAAQGVGEFILGAGGNVGGLVLDATGVGALVGVPAGVVSTAAMVHGGVTALTATTNLMKDGKSSGSGKAPIGDDGHPMELHHEGQKPEGPVKEMTRTEHRGGENFKKNHQNTGQQPSKIDRSKFRKFRKQYWKDKQNK